MECQPAPLRVSLTLQVPSALDLDTQVFTPSDFSLKALTKQLLGTAGSCKAYTGKRKFRLRLPAIIRPSGGAAESTGHPHLETHLRKAKGANMCRGSLVERLKVANASSTRHLGLRGESLIDPNFDILEMAGEGLGETATLGSAVARVGGRQSLNAK